LKRRPNVLTDEAAGLADFLRLAVNQQRCIGQLAPSLGRIAEQRACPALDIDPSVLARGARMVGELVEFLLAGHQGFGQRLENLGAAVEGQRAQVRTADASGVFGHGGEVQTVRPRNRHDIARDGAQDLRPTVDRLNPTAVGIVQNVVRFHSKNFLSDRKSGARVYW